MFQKWGFLLSEIWGLLLIAALLGLFAGWLIWARRRVEVIADTGEADRLRADLAACRKRGEELGARVSGLEADLAECGRKRAGLEAEPAKPVPAPVPAPAPVIAAAPAPLLSTPAPVVGKRPVGLEGARGGKADDLKLIKGVGPVLEKLCHRLGYFHFDQIAAWTADEIAWVDDNLEGFKGRVTRDEWVVQARDLAAGKPPRAGGAH